MLLDNIVYENENARLLFHEVCSVCPDFHIDYVPVPENDEDIVTEKEMLTIYNLLVPVPNNGQ